MLNELLVSIFTLASFLLQSYRQMEIVYSNIETLILRVRSVPPRITVIECHGVLVIQR